MGIFRKSRLSSQKHSVNTENKREKDAKCPDCGGIGSKSVFIDDCAGVSYVSGSAVSGGHYGSEPCKSCGGTGCIPRQDQTLTRGL